MMIEDEEQSFDHGFPDDEIYVLKYALEEFNEDTGMIWDMSDLDFIVTFPGPLTLRWYDEFNIYVQRVLDKIDMGTLML